jgi:hypothetical protein
MKLNNFLPISGGRGFSAPLTDDTEILGNVYGRRQHYSTSRVRTIVLVSVGSNEIIAFRYCQQFELLTRLYGDL